MVKGFSNGWVEWLRAGGQEISHICRGFLPFSIMSRPHPSQRPLPYHPSLSLTPSPLPSPLLPLSLSSFPPQVDSPPDRLLSRHAAHDQCPQQQHTLRRATLPDGRGENKCLGGNGRIENDGEIEVIFLVFVLFGCYFCIFT